MSLLDHDESKCAEETKSAVRWILDEMSQIVKEMSEMGSGFVDSSENRGEKASDRFFSDREFELTLTGLSSAPVRTAILLSLLHIERVRCGEFHLL